MSQTVQLRAVRSAHSPSKLPLRFSATRSAAVTLDVPTMERAKSAVVVGFKHTQSTRNLRQAMTAQNIKLQQRKPEIGRENIRNYIQDESDSDSANFSGKDSNEIEAAKLEKQAELQLATHEFKQFLLSKKMFKQLKINTLQQTTSKGSRTSESKERRRSTLTEDQQQAAALTRVLREQYNDRKRSRMLKLMRSNAAIPKSYRHELVCEWLAANEKQQTKAISSLRVGDASSALRIDDNVDREWSLIENGQENNVDGNAARERWDLFSERMPHHVLLESYSDAALQTRTFDFRTKERMIVLMQLAPQISHIVAAGGVANWLISRFLTIKLDLEPATVTSMNQPKSVPVKLFGLVLHFKTNNTALFVLETDVQQNLQILQRFLHPENAGFIAQLKILQIYPDVQLAPGSGFVHGFDVSPGYSQRVANRTLGDEKNWIQVAARVAYSVTQLSTLLWPYYDCGGRDQLLQEWQNLPNSFDFDPMWISTLLLRNELRTPFERLTQHREKMLFHAIDKISGRADDVRPENFYYYYWQAYNGKTEL